MNPPPNAGTIRVLLVDDHAILRQGLRLVLAALPLVQAVEEADSCLSALEVLAVSPPDVIIMDAHLPEIDGIESVRRIVARHPEARVIMLSGDSRASLIFESLQAGALAYVSKENAPEELARALQAVLDGKGYFSPDVAGAMAKHCRENRLALAPKAALLSDRETRLLQLIAQGKRNKEIAAEFQITDKSVEAYRSRLMAKLRCPSPAELTRFAIREGIASL